MTPASLSPAAASETFPAHLLRLVSSLGLAVLGAFPGGCRPASPESALPPPPQVTVAPVETREWMEWTELTGRTAPVEFVEVRPRVSGHIHEILFQAGQLVKKDEVLVRIDARWQKAELERREAELAMARVRADQAEREAGRNAQLLASRAVSHEEAESREARHAEARAAFLAAQAARDSARLDLDHTEIRAPVDGRVGRALVTVGNYVSGLAGAATILTTVVSVDPIYVYADLDERTLVRHRQLAAAGTLPKDEAGHLPVELRIGDENAPIRRGYLESLDNQVDARTGTIVLRAVVPNPDGSIIPGLFAHLRIPAGAKSPVLMVDEVAIGTDQAQKFVLSITSSNTTAYRPVVLGPRAGEKRVVRSGLQAGEKIVVNGLARVRPGMAVTPSDAPASASPAATGGR